MPKLKTKSGAKKRFRRRPQSMLRKARGTRIASAPDAKIIKRYFLPNA
jgi:ribosomal protein L35